MIINEDVVKVRHVGPNYQRAKPGQKFDRLAFVNVSYHGLDISGSLLRGKDKGGKYFYFFSLPHLMYKNGDRLKKVNVNNWPTKENSDQFQKIVIDSLIKTHPQLFHEDYEKNLLKICGIQEVQNG